MISTTPLNSTVDLSTSSAASDNQRIKRLEDQLHKANAALGERDVQLDAAKKALEKANSEIIAWNNHYKNAPVKTD